MYLIVLDESMGCVLGQQDETGKKEYAIYYLSKKFTDCESRYSMLKKTCPRQKLGIWQVTAS